MGLNITMSGSTANKGKVVKNNLGYLGVDFQYRLISSFFENTGFFKDMQSIIDQNMFTEPYLRSVVGVMKEYYAKYDSVPSYDIVVFKLREKALSDDDIQCYEEVIDKLKKTDTEGIEEIEGLAERFFKQQNLIRVAHEILRIAGDGDTDRYGECQQLVEEAMTVGNRSEEASSPLEDVERDLSKDSVITVPTGVRKLDEALGGGLDIGKIGLIMGPTSFGKSLIINELVATPYGFVQAKDIKVGDKMIGSNGKPTTVLGVFPQGIRPIYRVTFNDGTYYDCDENHILPVNTFYQRSGKKYSKKEHKKVYTPDRSFKNMTLREIIDSGLYRSGHRYNFATPIAKPVEFEDIPLDVDPYLIGVLIGDGCLGSHNFVYSINDTIIKERAMRNINEDSYSIRKSKEKLYEVRLLKPIWDKVKLLLNEDSRSAIKYIPKEILYNSIEKRIALLNGLMDTDGFVSKNGFCHYNTKSKRLSEDFCALVRSLGGLATIHEKNSGYKDKNGNKIDCGINYEVSFGLFDKNIPISTLPRKQERVKYYSGEKFLKFIKSVEYIKDDEAVCFYVDADDHLFLTRDYNVTHNTSMTTGFAAYEAAFQCEGNDFGGFKVLQIIFEDSKRDINRKYFSRMSQIETKSINESEETTQAVREAVNNHPDYELIKDNIRIMPLATGEYSASRIKEAIKKKINEGFRPNVVIIDYFECLDPEKGTTKLAKWEQENKTMRKLEAMAKELNVAIWLPTQGNRGSLSSDLVTMDQGSGSIGKQQIAQVVISITRSVDDIRNQKATVSVLKNRSGSAGIVLQGIKFDNGTCTISSDDVIDFSDPLAYIDYVDEYEENQRNNAIDDLRKGERRYKS